MPSFISAIKTQWRTAATVASLLAALFLLDRISGAALTFAYNKSSASPLVALRASGAATAVVGTSTARYAIVPTAWPSNLVNFAQDGQTFFYSIAMARILSSEPNVRRIILGLDPYDLNSGLSNPSASRVWRIAPTINAYPDLAPLLADTRPGGSSVLTFLATWPYRGAITQIIRGFGKSLVPQYAQLAAGSVVEPSTQGEFAPLAFSASLDPYIDVLSNVARRPDLQIILVVTPAYKDDRAAHPAQAQLISELIRRLKGAPVCNLTGIDTPALDAVRSNSANFHDNVHLTEGGGRTYTEELNRLIGQHCS
ncbi:hypothetical protein RPMA_09775 [Tardiphaga alba]|uniref:SGNH/GDSL hydrolase family protein n=1 Tax=Tardiphaga alba TaxID=340268 RepID=A0ABX8A5T5_9BRAD|nr:hypothetical protein [Tardiphaga alba]QUS39091.1 hypothetical protein RPMA_09775 [Tardiphaga alba]